MSTIDQTYASQSWFNVFFHFEGKEYHLDDRVAAMAGRLFSAVRFEFQFHHRAENLAHYAQHLNEENLRNILHFYSKGELLLKKEMDLYKNLKLIAVEYQMEFLAHYLDVFISGFKFSPIDRLELAAIQQNITKFIGSYRLIGKEEKETMGCRINRAMVHLNLDSLQRLMDECPCEEFDRLALNYMKAHNDEQRLEMLKSLRHEKLRFICIMSCELPTNQILGINSFQGSYRQALIKHYVNCFNANNRVLWKLAEDLVVLRDQKAWFTFICEIITHGWLKFAQTIKNFLKDEVHLLTVEMLLEAAKQSNQKKYSVEKVVRVQNQTEILNDIRSYLDFLLKEEFRLQRFNFETDLWNLRGILPHIQKLLSEKFSLNDFSEKESRLLNETYLLREMIASARRLYENKPA